MSCILWNCLNAFPSHFPVHVLVIHVHRAITISAWSNTGQNYFNMFKVISNTCKRHYLPWRSGLDYFSIISLSRYRVTRFDMNLDVFPYFFTHRQSLTHCLGMLKQTMSLRFTHFVCFPKELYIEVLKFAMH